jgi:Tfp pilus assembly protein PilX
MKKRQSHHGDQLKSGALRTQRGMALVLTLLSLVLLSGVALGLLFMTDSETKIDGNYRDTQLAYFAARAGLEEARYRILNDATFKSTYLPTTVPLSGANTGITYIINKASASDTSINPRTAGTSFDDEYCHENFQGATNVGAGSPCSTAILSGTYQTVASSGPDNQTTKMLAYKWVRITLKQNNMLQRTSTADTTSYVDAGKGAGNVVCWDGTSEQVGSGTAATTCPSGSNPVYVLTSLAYAPRGSTRMLQMEMAITPTKSASPFVYGMYALGTSCNALTLNGNQTADGYDSSKGAYGGTNLSVHGDLASNGTINISPNSSQIKGTFFTPSNTIGWLSTNNDKTTKPITCQDVGGVGHQMQTTQVGGVTTTTDLGPLGVLASNNNSTCAWGFTGTPCIMAPLINPPTITTPSAPVISKQATVPGSTQCPGATKSTGLCQYSAGYATPLTQTDLNPPSGGSNAPSLHVSNSGTVKLSSGTYNLWDVTVDGSTTLNLAPGTYNMNSLYVTGSGKIVINPPCTAGTYPCVTINLLGNSTPLTDSVTGNPAALIISGAGMANNSGDPGQLLINYAGTSDILFDAGNGSNTATAAVMAPNAEIVTNGNVPVFGAFIGKNILLKGGPSAFHYDTHLASAFGGGGGAGSPQLLAFREIMY